jgi:hypothetical protein
VEPLALKKNHLDIAQVEVLMSGAHLSLQLTAAPSWYSRSYLSCAAS